MLEEFGDYLVPQGVAYVLDVSVTTVYDLIHSKQLPAARVGKKLWRIPKQALKDYLEKELHIYE